MDTLAWQPLGLAVGLGLLVGLQREWAGAGAGIRTFPLIAVFGVVSALLAEAYGGWVLAGGLVALAALLVVLNLDRREESDAVHPGPTTEVAALIMFGVGAMLVLGHTVLATAVAGGMAVLLQWKRPLHGFVGRIGGDEIRAVFRLVLIAMVVLPVLPDREYGPYDVLNPFRIWLMVVLIVSISIAGYLASKYLGSRTGSLLAGLLGGMISSTATTVGYARRANQSEAAASLASVIIIIASAVVFVRVAAEVALVAPSVVPQVMPQLAAMALMMGAIAVGVYTWTPPPAESSETPEDPSELSAAVTFGALYAFVLLAVAVAEDRYGASGLYFVAVLSGLTDLDAITLSTAELMMAGRVTIDIGWRMILVGSLSNIFFKTVVVAALGPRGLVRQVSLSFGLAFAGGVLLLWLWPAH